MRNQQDAEQYFAPYMSQLYQAVSTAITFYRSSPMFLDLRADFTKRSHSSNLNDLIWKQLRVAFEDGGEATFHNRGNRQLMRIGDYALRVKKLDGAMRPQNHPTQAVLEFLEQRFEQLHLPGMEPPTNLDLGYRLTGPGEDTLEVYLRCPKGLKAYNWLCPLPEPSEPSVAEEVPDVAAEPAVPPRRVRLREEEMEEREEVHANGEK